MVQISFAFIAGSKLCWMAEQNPLSSKVLVKTEGGTTTVLSRFQTWKEQCKWGICGKTIKESPLQAKQAEIFSDFLRSEYIRYFISLSFRPKTKRIGSTVHIYHNCTLALPANRLCKTAMKSRLAHL